jgi:hypothetical protein
VKPEFSQASESFKAANPHIFGQGGDASSNQTPMKYEAAPTVPSAGAAPTKAELKLEKELQEQIVGFLERNNTVVIRSRMDRKTSTNVGTPDLLFALKGRAVAFEVKRPGEKPTHTQWKMMDQMTANGWLCYVIDSYDQAVEAYQKLFLKFTIDASES